MIYLLAIKSFQSHTVYIHVFEHVNFSHNIYGLDKALTLEESAREFQARIEKHVDFKEVDVVTGEEGESNVLQVQLLGTPR